MHRRYGKGRLLGLDIAYGLAFLHAHDIIHFDIKSRCAMAYEPPILSIKSAWRASLPRLHITVTRANLHRLALPNASGVTSSDLGSRVL